MKKIFTLVGIGAIAFANAQQGNLGINTIPNNATLEIKVADTNANNGTNQGVLIPKLSKTRVATIADDKLVKGTLVFVEDTTYAGTNAKVSDITEDGFYYYNGSQWTKIGGDALPSGTISGQVLKWNGSSWISDIETDGIVGNEVIGATSNRGLQRAGIGTNTDPFTLGIAPEGIDGTMIKPKQISNNHIVESYGLVHWLFDNANQFSTDITDNMRVGDVIMSAKLKCHEKNLRKMYVSIGGGMTYICGRHHIDLSKYYWFRGGAWNDDGLENEDTIYVLNNRIEPGTSGTPALQSNELLIRGVLMRIY